MLLVVCVLLVASTSSCLALHGSASTAQLLYNIYNTIATEIDNSFTDSYAPARPTTHVKPISSRNSNKLCEQGTVTRVRRAVGRCSPPPSNCPQYRRCQGAEGEERLCRTRSCTTALPDSVQTSGGKALSFAFNKLSSSSQACIHSRPDTY